MAQKGRGRAPSGCPLGHFALALKCEAFYGYSMQNGRLPPLLLLRFSLLSKK